MNADALLTGTYIKAAEFDGTTIPRTPTWTIARVAVEELPDLKRQDATKNKGVIYFREQERGWVMNRTNVECLKALFGPQTDGWIGRRVTLCTEPTRTGDGIRVYGSPDITEPVVATWRVPKKAAQSKRMVPTGTPSQPGKSSADRAQRPPDPDPYAGLRTRLEAAGIHLDDAREYADAVGLAHDTPDARKALHTALTTEGEHKAAFADMLAQRGGGS